MGLTSSKHSPKDKSYHSDCDCVLYTEYNHCCKIECVGGMEQKERMRIELSNALKQYHLDYIVDIILGYLHSLEVVRFQNNKVSKQDNANYQVFAHSATVDRYPDLPCSFWRQSKAMTDKNGCIEMRCVVLGLGGVGKSALTIRFVADVFLEEYDPTIEDSYRKQVDVNGQEVLFDVLDTAGREEFSSMEDHWIKEGKLFLLCFSIDSRVSYDEAICKRERILRTKDNEKGDYGMILVATKCDLWYDKEWIRQNNKQKNPRKFVERQMVIDQAKEWNIGYIETSAKSHKNVSVVFEQALYEWWIQSQAQIYSHYA